MSTTIPAIPSRVICRPQDRSQSFWRRIMEIFGFLSNTILAGISKPPFNASLAGSLIAWIRWQVSIYVTRRDDRTMI
jgi:hypothetical protein